ncbi:fibronectin type III domain-containing protein [Candidatus Peregrinibacteria bacterium]|nr:fibronectin type III domain-containing protein [Candidatus Peregrinibacteria bacterium]
MKTKTFKICTALVSLAIFSVANMTAFAASDSTKPSDVENFKGTALDASVKLTWDAATDNVAVTGYKVYYGLKPVAKSGETYDSNKDAGSVLNYTLTGLTNDKKYYFLFFFYDAAGNESGSWAKEISLTPVKGAAGSDKEAPKVSSAVAMNKEQVKVVFSEAVVLPLQDPQDAFTVEDDNFKPLAVLKAEMDKDDKEEKIVVLTTAAQKKDVKYKLTVGIDLKDKAGNPIISGTSDIAGFTGSDAEKPAEDKKAPEVTKVESMDSTHVIVTFNEGIVLGIDPSKNFSVMQEADSKKTLDVLGVELGKNGAGVEDASAIVTTSAQENVNYVVVVSGVKDADSNEINPAKGSGKFMGASAKAEKEGGDKIKDIIPPKDVLNLLAKKTLDAKNYIVTLTWSMPI